MAAMRFASSLPPLPGARKIIPTTATGEQAEGGVIVGKVVNVLS